MSYHIKVALIAIVQMAIIATCVYYFHNPVLQLKNQKADTVCLQSDTLYRLCAQCHSRHRLQPHNKGYEITADNTASVLKIRTPSNILSCNDYLQMIDFRKNAGDGADFHIEQIPSVIKILG